MNRWAKSLGIGAAALGGLALAVTVERIALRAFLKATPVGDIPDAPHATNVLRLHSDDGCEIHVEVDTPEDMTPATPTVVLTHGFGMAAQSWWPQRRALRKLARVVVWDQRGHGRSGYANAAAEAIVIDRLAMELAMINDEVTTGDVVCIGHSMGGMTIMALTELRPDLFTDRIKGVVLLATSAGSIGDVTLGLPGPIAKIAHQVPSALRMALAGHDRRHDFFSRIRRSDTDLGLALVRRFAFGETVPEGGPELVARLLNETASVAVTDLLVDVYQHDRRGVLAPLRQVPTLIVVGTADLLTPVEHSREIAGDLPDAQLVELAGVGHMLGLEQAVRVNELLTRFVLEVSDRRE